MNIFFTSDLHFWHKNVIRFDNRPFEGVVDMYETIIDRWNKKVKPKDSVYILGDFLFGSKDSVRKATERLNGNLHLILGNHDYRVIKGEAIKNFAWVKDFYLLRIQKGLPYNKMGKIALSHYPMLSWPNSHHGSWMLHGHTHQTERMPDKSQLRINVGVNAWDYEPVSLDELCEYVKNTYTGIFTKSDNEYG